MLFTPRIPYKVNKVSNLCPVSPIPKTPGISRCVTPASVVIARPNRGSGGGSAALSDDLIRPDMRL
jgi:hypothetical protein